MKYKIELEGDDWVYIGSVLDKEPHGKVGRIMNMMQAQISQQDVAEQNRIAAEGKKVTNDWFEKETKRRAVEAAKVKADEAKSSRKRKANGHAQPDSTAMEEAVPPDHTVNEGA